MNNIVFSTRLKAIRKQKNLTMLELSEMTGIAKSSISLYESGDRVPSINNVISLSKALKVPINELTGSDVTDKDKQSYLDYVSKKYGLDRVFMDLVKLDDKELLRLEEDIELALRVIKEKYKL